MSHHDSIIEVATLVGAPIRTVWQCWTELSHIGNWAFASDDWEAVALENDLQEGGKFVTRMHAKDGSVGFEFGGVYSEVIPEQVLAYVLGDGRRVRVVFEPVGDGVNVVQQFEPEAKNTVEQQREGWQSILNNFKAYVEKQAV